MTVKHRQYSATSHLYHLQFIVTSALEFFVFTSHLLAMGLSTQTITISLNHTFQVLHTNQLIYSDVSSSRADLLFSSVFLVPIRCLCLPASAAAIIHSSLNYNCRCIHFSSGNDCLIWSSPHLELPPESKSKLCYDWPRKFLIKDYTEILYTIYKWNVPSIQCKKRLRWSNLIQEVDCPSLVFIDFNVPTLTPGHHWVQAMLEFSENIAFLVFCHIKASVISKES
jgi:hypothetical protein